MHCLHWLVLFEYLFIQQRDQLLKSEMMDLYFQITWEKGKTNREVYALLCREAKMSPGEKKRESRQNGNCPVLSFLSSPSNWQLP